MNLCETQTPAVYLSGFSQALNWRPTEFVNRLHRVRVCNLCGVVPGEAYLLECSHVFCKTCYDGVVGCGQVCPIDDAPFHETQVTSLKFPESDLLKREVRCWNKHRGCDFSGTLADALNHFHEVCAFHEVRCGKCHKMVRQRDMVDHHKGGCEGERDEEEPGTISLAKDILKSTSGMKAMLATLADTQASLQDSLNNLTAETRGCLQSVEKRIDDQNAELLQVRRNQEESGRSSYEAFDDIRASLTGIRGLIQQHKEVRPRVPDVQERGIQAYANPVPPPLPPLPGFGRGGQQKTVPYRVPPPPRRPADARAGQQGTIPYRVPPPPLQGAGQQ